MSCKVYTVIIGDPLENFAFLVRADHEQHARDLVRDLLIKQSFKAKLQHGESIGGVIEVERAYLDDRVLLLWLGDGKKIGFNEVCIDKEMKAVETTNTVRLTLAHIRHKEENKVNLISAVAEESKLARAYRRHLNILEEWVTD